MHPSLTVLTDPIPVGKYYLSERFKKIARKIRDFIKPRPHYMRSSYRGHFAVTRCLVEGLKKINAYANYNPNQLSGLANTVVVLAGISTLKQAIELKQSGRIRRLLAGPNIVDFPSDYKELITSPAVDLYIVNSQWTHDLYIKDCPPLNDRCAIWPAGVDTEFWKASGITKNRATILVFEKLYLDTAGSIVDYVTFLKKRGYGVDFIKYGNYSPKEYLFKLQQADLMVGFSYSESQGIAWAEAWSVGVPTLILKNETSYYRGKTLASSTAPYLTVENGMFFDNLSNFKFVMSYWENNRSQFQPRKWVLENMSDNVCAQNLLDIALGRENMTL